jgi:translin
MPLKTIMRKIGKELELKDEVREKVLDVSRTIVRLSSQAILAIHRGRLNPAQKRIESAKKNLRKMEELLRKSPEIASSGFVYTAYQEYAEANLLLNFVLNEDFPTPERLGIPSIPYILGLSDLVGELRRKALDSMREGDLKLAERCLRTMEDVYNSFISIEKGHALVPGFRMKGDAIRKRIESTRGDITIGAMMRRRGGEAKT